VAFTSDRHNTGRNSESLVVKYVKNIKGPGRYSTDIWWDAVGRELLGNDDQLWLDNLKAHHSKMFLEEVRSYGVTVRFFPNHAGAILNPMDNSFWADFRAQYYRMTKEDHGQMLDAIRTSYWHPADETIVRYWHHCGYTSQESPKDAVIRLLSEGYDPIADRFQDEHDAMLSQYRVWSANRKALRCGTLPQAAPQSLGFCGLDGVYWTAYVR